MYGDLQPCGIRGVEWEEGDGTERDADGVEEEVWGGGVGGEAVDEG